MAGPHLTLGQPLSLELYTSENFMGFFVKDDDANYLKRLAMQYVKDVSGSSECLREKKNAFFGIFNKIKKKKIYVNYHPLFLYLTINIFFPLFLFWVISNQ